MTTYMPLCLIGSLVAFHQMFLALVFASKKVEIRFSHMSISRLHEATSLLVYSSNGVLFIVNLLVAWSVMGWTLIGH
jgi:hypothetical protein